MVIDKTVLAFGLAFGAAIAAGIGTSAYVLRKKEKQVDEKTQRIRELWDALNEAHSYIMTYGLMHYSYADPDWEPPSWLRGCEEYTTEQRLKDIRHNCKKLEEVMKKINKVMFDRCWRDF